MSGNRCRGCGGETGTRRGPAGRLLVCLLAALLAATIYGLGPESDRQDQPRKKRKEAAPYALLFGTVFDESGRLVRGASVRVRQKEAKKQWEAVSDTQGEFAVHLPAAPAVYLVEATAPGFSRDSKQVSFTADERQDVVLRISRLKDEDRETRK